MTFTFDARLWRWREGSWFFVTLPHDVSDEIDDATAGMTGGFGAVKVAVRVGATEWSTSIFPSKEEKSFVLPVKKAVRSAEDLHEGSTTTFQLTLV
ncbi:hypothetical protein ASD11_11765 [Aeromicrobium sp. Root495]|uniref:DUF1905 domain-containing protein n=1 Tax=Aeromicrobium sp. Root495 TaxID=1736550 RepID=UPI0006F5F9C3|nr:DUF1905 domain-containing protein [Aeromicrobium sp. Root495]KQY60151.1 hypothetical protein ASD11_11765 [Aeromicrobium sp. Root495]